MSLSARERLACVTYLSSLSAPVIPTQRAHTAPPASSTADDLVAAAGFAVRVEQVLAMWASSAAGLGVAKPRAQHLAGWGDRG